MSVKCQKRLAVTVPHLGAALLQRDTTTFLPTQLATQTATAYVQGAGLDLTGVVVISEAEHDNDYIMQSGDEIPRAVRSKSSYKPCRDEHSADS